MYPGVLSFEGWMRSRHRFWGAEAYVRTVNNVSGNYTYPESSIRERLTGRRTSSPPQLGQMSPNESAQFGHQVHS